MQFTNFLFSLRLLIQDKSQSHRINWRMNQSALLYATKWTSLSRYRTRQARASWRPPFWGPIKWASLQRLQKRVTGTTSALYLVKPVNTRWWSCLSRIPCRWVGDFSLKGAAECFGFYAILIGRRLNTHPEIKAEYFSFSVMSYNVKWIRSRIRWPIIWLTISNFMIFMQSRNILGGAPRRRTNVDMALALYGARITCREVIQTIKCFTPQFHLPRDKFSFYLLSFLRWIL